MNRTREIIDMARGVRNSWGSDPLKVAEKLGINVRENSGPKPAAYLFKIAEYPAMIALNGCRDELTKKVLCAHELGHAMLDHGNIRNYDGYQNPQDCREEYEANLFAVAYFIDDDEINRPLDEMPNFMLRMILEENIG